MRREEVEAEGEVRGGEDGEGFDEDVGDGFVAREVRVELVAVGRERRRGWLLVRVCGEERYRKVGGRRGERERKKEKEGGKGGQIELIN